MPNARRDDLSHRVGSGGVNWFRDDSILASTENLKPKRVEPRTELKAKKPLNLEDPEFWKLYGAWGKISRPKTNLKAWIEPLELQHTKIILEKWEIHCESEKKTIPCYYVSIPSFFDSRCSYYHKVTEKRLAINGTCTSSCLQCTVL